MSSNIIGTFCAAAIASATVVTNVWVTPFTDPFAARRAALKDEIDMSIDGPT